MSSAIHDRIVERIVHCFNRPLIQNDLRGMYVEFMVADILGAGWRVTGENWAGWDLEHVDGTRLEIKQSAAKQSWGPSAKGYTSPKFSIRTPTEFWVGAIAGKAVSRLAHIYVFAWQGSTSEVTDHRDPSQWDFYVAPTSALPDQKSLALTKVKGIAVHATAETLAEKVDALRRQGKRQ
jgi:hypothetical protein